MSSTRKVAVVTGGAGFIGGHMVDVLLDRGCRVRVIDNLSGGRTANLAHHARNPDLSFEESDIRDLVPDASLFRGADYVFHFAGIGDIVPSIERPLEYMDTNVQGTVYVLEAARHARVRKFVYAASSSCYGIPTVYPTPETAPADPLYPYALTKYLGEQLVLHWARLYRLPAVSIRFFNVYGPRARTSGTYGAVFGVFLAQLLAGRPLTIVGGGTQTRDFTFVSDAVDALLLAAEAGQRGEVFNVGSGKPTSVNELVRLLGAPPTVHIPKRPGEPDCTWADITKIGTELGWKPQVSVDDGVRIMLDNIDYWRDAPVWTTERIAEATSDWFRHLGDGGDRGESGER